MNRRKKIQHSKNTHRKCVKRMTSERRMLRMLTTSVVSLALIKYNLLVRTYPVWNRQTLYYCENSSEFMSFKNNWNMQINHTKNIAHLKFFVGLNNLFIFSTSKFFRSRLRWEFIVVVVFDSKQLLWSWHFNKSFFFCLLLSQSALKGKSI